MNSTLRFWEGFMFVNLFFALLICFAISAKYGKKWFKTSKARIGLSTYVGLSSVILMCLLAYESWDSILNFAKRFWSASDSPIWLDLTAAQVTVVAALVYGVAVSLFAALGIFIASRIDRRSAFETQKIEANHQPARRLVHQRIRVGFLHPQEILNQIQAADGKFTTSSIILHAEPEEDI